MMRRKILPFLLVLIFSGCIDDTYFGLSKDANIILFDIEGQLSNKVEPMVDWEDVGEITITVPTTYDLKKLKVAQATCSQLARFTVDPYTLTDFSTPVEIIVGAENTSVRKKWIVTVTNDGEISNQLAFSKMDRWTIAKNSSNKEIVYTENSVEKKAYFPGVGSAISPWQTPAEANAFSSSGINTVTVGPKPTLALAEYGRIETIWVKSGQAAIAKAQVVTGALFTGSFLFNIKYAPFIGTNEPRKMVNIGTPFTFRPKSATFKMRYLPGDVMRDGEGKEITVGNAAGRPMVDSCDIYVILHNRTSDEAKYIRVAAAHLRTSGVIGDMNNDASGFVEQTIPFVYGQPDAATLLEKPYMNIGGSRGELTFYKFPVTEISTPIAEIFASDPDATEVDHISVLFSSSAYGDNFWGAVNDPGGTYRGSTLDIKDFQLVYE